MRRNVRDPDGTHPPFAPPFLKDGDLLVGQTIAILQYLAPTLKLVARSEQARVWTHQIQLTICDMVAEAHDTHHPVRRVTTAPMPRGARRARDDILQPATSGGFSPSARPVRRSPENGHERSKSFWRHRRGDLGLLRSVTHIWRFLTTGFIMRAVVKAAPGVGMDVVERPVPDARSCLHDLSLIHISEPTRPY